ncbi:uncharacterized protein LOC120091917 [Benincasa hispida]|uniref:uncharacterized protein LOC120091917 n=1 Tax=Benincasa hispida TaxID=102211 RepID=UPI0019022322|nr:uncharacterized protein LOC120091917 [Benincasa hispida]
MNQNSHGFFFFFFLSFLFIFLLFSSHSASARFPSSKQGIEETHKKISHGMVQADSWPDFPHIMGGREKGGGGGGGGEEEEEEEEEWEKGKMMLEAHLDYVYTQNEKP